MNKSDKIFVAMSGGVDSSVAAYLLKSQGFNISGIFMKNWEEDDSEEYCASAKDLADAQSVCNTLDITLHQVNFSAEYWEHVFAYFLKEYQAGRTPNPDILCNREIKFKTLHHHAMQLGAQKIATGHYARIQSLNDQYFLLRGLDQSKDQSYFLYALDQQQLSRSLFPIGDLQKTEVRQIAKKLGLKTHDKKDSTGICFIGERKFKDFLEKYLPAKPGNIETDQGKLIGKHDGLMFYTIGQRQGLQIGGNKEFNNQPWYVISKDLSRNVLIVAAGENHPALFCDTLICEQSHWINKIPGFPFTCQAKIRYRQQQEECTVTYIDEQHLKIHFKMPQRAITPGQSIVFYDDEKCLGGAVITKT